MPVRLFPSAYAAGPLARPRRAAEWGGPGFHGRPYEAADFARIIAGPGPRDAARTSVRLGTVDGLESPPGLLLSRVFTDQADLA